ncbi:MAG: hypothetical protein ACLQVF_06170 [Isosphaeraceae bacterium]
MRQSGNAIAARARAQAGDEPSTTSGRSRPAGRRTTGAEPARSWLFEPKTAIWIALGAALVLGGGRKLLASWRARRAIARLAFPNATPEEIELVADHGRAGVWELLRVFSAAGTSPQQQAAAGRALARLWQKDELVAEEEQAVVRRGFTVTWKARRRYPRALRSEIPVSVAYEVPFLRDDGRGIGPDNLEWSHRVLGARRAALEEFSAWKPGRGQVAFTIVPGDFESHGPHRLVLQTRVRTAGLSGRWEIEPPHIPFNFEFDPILRIESMLTLPDAGRDELISRALWLEASFPGNGEPSRYVAIGDEWTLKNPPCLAVATPLPCDLAHVISIELDGVPGRFPAGRIVLSDQGPGVRDPSTPRPQPARFELSSISSLPQDAIDRPGIRRMRLVLEADPACGWADPDIRSIWPGRIETGWVEVEIVRR